MRRQKVPMSRADARHAILIAGPTASGKSALALALAEALGGTIINADSMQVYRDLRILTARPPGRGGGGGALPFSSAARGRGPSLFPAAGGGARRAPRGPGWGGGGAGRWWAAPPPFIQGRCRGGFPPPRRSRPRSAQRSEAAS